MSTRCTLGEAPGWQQPVFETALQDCCLCLLGAGTRRTCRRTEKQENETSKPDLCECQSTALGLSSRVSGGWVTPGLWRKSLELLLAWQHSLCSCCVSCRHNSLVPFSLRHLLSDEVILFPIYFSLQNYQNDRFSIK